MPVELTRDADKLLALMYKKYLETKDNGMPRSEAKHMGGSDLIRESLMPTVSQDDVDDLCRELSRANYLHAIFADDTIYDSYLENTAIIYLENRFKRGLLSVADFISKFIP